MGWVRRLSPRAQVFLQSILHSQSLVDHVLGGVYLVAAEDPQGAFAHICAPRVSLTAVPSGRPPQPTTERRDRRREKQWARKVDSP